MTTFTRANPTPDPLALAAGFGNWNMHPAQAAATLTPTSQTIYVSALWLPAGVPVNDICVGVTTAAAGTVPTGMYVGLCSPSAVVAQSSNLKSDTGWTHTGIQTLALSSSYTPSAAGMFYAFLLQNGTFGTTQPVFIQRSTSGMGSDTYKLWGTIGTGQSAPPANGTAITVTINSTCLFVATK